MHPATVRGSFVPILFATTLFISALLLFMVQPMIGLMVLPCLGGSPAAWNTCMVFFQFVLLLGYLYAHRLTSRYSPRRQFTIHLGVLSLAIMAFAIAMAVGEKHSPIAIVKSLAPQSTSYPMFGVLALLAIAIGVPFFAVSTTAPLLQHWFSNTNHPAAKDPYFLYAASNVGSLISLLAYPFITQPVLGLSHQAWFWAAGFAVFLVTVFVCGRVGLKATPQPDLVESQSTKATPLPPIRIVKWVALAFVPSSLMLGVTTYMTTDIASIPLLWVIPLALYLVTFIIAFARTPSWFRLLLGNVAPVLTLLLIYVIITQQSMPSQFWLLGLHIVAYFFLALMCHTELAHDRPDPAHLTAYYLWISVGGVLGGVFNALLAPIIFPLAFEYTIALGLGCLLVPKFASNDDSKPSTWAPFLDILIPLMLMLCVSWVNVFSSADWFKGLCKWISEHISSAAQFCGLGIKLEAGPVRDGLNWAVPLIACFFFIDRPLRFGLCVAAVLLVGEFRRANMDQELHTERSFFGILKVQDNRKTLYERTESGWAIVFENGKPVEQENMHSLVHGTTLHGKQGRVAFPVMNSSNAYLDNQYAAVVGWAGVAAYDWRIEPLTYYHRTGAVGHMFTVTRERFAKPGVAMVGLGTGSAACYANQHLDLTFYEIDPTVKKLVADTDQYFTYVSDARKRGAKVDFVMGDARLKLEENTTAKYDLLLVDAFSSDSIPVHLITKEALQLYLDRLNTGGLLGLHISNKFVNLEYVVERLSRELGVAALVFNDSFIDKEDSYELQDAPPGKTSSSWVVIAKDVDRLKVFAEDRFTTQYRYAKEPVRIDADGTRTPLVPGINRWQPLAGNDLVKPWTDDYSDVLIVMMLPEVQKVRKFFGMATIPELVK